MSNKIDSKNKIIDNKKNNKNNNTNKNKSSKKMGRKPKWKYWLTEEGLMLISGWARDGFTEEEIAKNMGIGRSTLNEWKIRFPNLTDTIKKNKQVSDYLVEGSVFKSIMGYTMSYKNEKVTKDGDVVEYEETVYIPPNPTLSIFWLKNRMPDKWREKVEIIPGNAEKRVTIVNDIPKNKEGN